MKTPAMELRVLTEEQFQAMMTDRQDAITRERRILELAETINRENIALKAGLIFYNKEQVANMLHCSTKQVERYEASGKLTGTRFTSRVLFSASSLMIFVDEYNIVGVKLPKQSSYPRRKRRSKMIISPDSCQ
ncbi:hypothetical protein EXU85_24340 [Spirosoma sp. KCTC 42546]|uniref:hypothetical protein n=1 Tax=Spirosoma sp. KCTC 42546 TaxID=2520506 RepID=UPI00115B1395|nr:hypothetical protein [Spirosoma sp. KCTC 42546]QDK81568.1 hypothetical protein EXU85_24340 [Spirosoma sp. KCTC 42546]